MNISRIAKNIDTAFNKFENSFIGKFFIEKVFFRKKSFYSLVTFLISILISQLASFKYADNLSIKINTNIEKTIKYVQKNFMQFPFCSLGNKQNTKQLINI